MLENIRIKAGAIQNLTDARYFASKGVEWVGFNFSPEAAQFIQPREAQQIMGWLEGPKTVGEFEGRPMAEVRETAMILNLDMVQLPHHEITEEALQLEQPIIAVVDVQEGLAEVVQQLKDKAAMVQLNCGPQFNDWDAIAQISREVEVILDAPFTRDNFLSIIETVQPAAINLRGGTEQKIGERSFEELDELFELIQFEL